MASEPQLDRALVGRAVRRLKKGCTPESALHWAARQQAAALLTVIMLVLHGAAGAQIEVLTKPGDNLTKLLQAHGAPESPEALQALIDTTVRNNGHAFRDRDPDRLIPDIVVVLPLERPAPPPPEPAPAPEPPPGPSPIGVIEVVKGRTEVQRGARSTAVVAEAPVFVDDRIATAPASRARLRMDDGSQFELGPSTRFVVEEYQSPADDNPGRMLLNLVRGGIRAVSGLIGKRLGSVFELKTSTATIGIRGTDYVARFCDDRCGELPGASVGVADGAVVLQNDAGEVQLNTGEFGRAESAASAPASAPLPEGFFDLERDVSEITVDRTWFDDVLDALRSLFE